MIKKELRLNSTRSSNQFVDPNIEKQEKLKKAITLQKYYKSIIVEDLILKQGYINVMEIPKITKIVINTSSKIIIKDKKYLIPSLIALEIITGQNLQVRGAKKSIAIFKCRQNQLIGCKVTLRGSKMTAFLEKLINVILPRLRDFRGFQKKGFDPQGHYNLGIKNYLLFPELENFFEFFEFLTGINISINTYTKNKKEASILLTSFQIPTVFIQ